jgi:hypothetical protein
MQRPSLRYLLVLLFALPVGHVAWRVYLAPREESEYIAGGELPALAGADPDARHLFLRRTLHLPQKPRHAWLELLATDRVHLLVNGHFVESKRLDGYCVAIVADLTRHLLPGKNVIGIHASQSSMGRPPRVAVRGGYVLSDGEHPIAADEEWRYTDHFERRDSWWFTEQFDEKNLPRAVITTANLRAKTTMPTACVQNSERGRWATPRRLEAESAILRRVFEMPSHAEHAWLRLTASSSYRVAINGILVDTAEETVGVSVRAGLTERLYNITSMVHSGQNVVQVVLTSSSALPHLRADVNIIDQNGNARAWNQESPWLSRPGAAGWMDTGVDRDDDWQRCRVEHGDLSIPVEDVPTQVVTTILPWRERAWRIAQELMCIALLALGVYLLTRLIAFQLETLGGNGNLAFLALALSPTLVIAALLAVYDPRVARQDVYRSELLALAVLLVAGQWLGLLIVASRRRAASVIGRVWEMLTSNPVWIEHVALIALIGAGVYVRFGDLRSQPLQWDEVENYNVTMSFMERGSPVMIVHEDLPPLMIHTSELEFIPHALMALVSSDPIDIVRMPSVVFGVLTIPLLYWVGRRMMNGGVGLIAATWFTFSPVCVATSTFGRYFSELQFFTLLLIYFLWMALRGAGPINKRALWLATLSFLGMFFTWEASALLAPSIVIACLVQRRGRLRQTFLQNSVWQALAIAGIFVVLQRTYATFAQIQFLWYGVSLSDVKLMAMWEHQIFRPWFYIWQSVWSQDCLLPLLALLGAIVLAAYHPYRRQLRFLLIIHVGACMLMAFTLPNLAYRYSYHLIPPMILIAATTVWALTHGLCRWALRTGVGAWWSAYTAISGLAVAAVILAVGSGAIFEMRELDRFRVEGLSTSLYKFANLEGPAQFVREHIRDGDVVIANDTFQINHLMGHQHGKSRRVEYALSNHPFVPGTLDDRHGIMLDRRDGAKVIYTPEMLRAFFDEHPRVWYISSPGHHYLLNSRRISTFLRTRMRVAYQDWDSLVLFAGDEHRPNYLILEDERRLEDSRDSFLR